MKAFSTFPDIPPEDAFLKLRHLEIFGVDDGGQILREMFKRAPNIDSLFLRETHLGDEMLKELESFQSLTELDVQRIEPIRPCSLSNLQNLKHLTILKSSSNDFPILESFPIDLSTVPTLSNLQSLRMNGFFVEDHLSSLAFCKKLTSLELLLSPKEGEIPIITQFLR